MKITRISEALGKIDDEISREAVEQFEQKSIQTNNAPAEKPRVIYEHKTRKAPILIAAASICAAAAIAVPVVNHFRTANLIADNPSGAADSKVVDYSAEESDSNITPDIIESESVKVFKEYFENTLIDPIYGNFSDFIKPLNMTERKNGVTINLHEMFKCNDWVILSMSCDVEETYFTQPVHFIPEPTTNCTIYSKEIDGKVFIKLHLNDCEVSGNSAHIDFNSLGCYNNEGDQIDSMKVSRNEQKEDSIGFDIPVDFNNIAPTVVTDIKDFVGNDELTFKRISVSPYYCDIDFDGAETRGRYESVDFRFLKKDGTNLFPSGVNFWADMDNKQSFYFTKAIDPNELAAVEINYYIKRRGEKINYEAQEPVSNDIHAVIDVSTGKLIDGQTDSETDAMTANVEMLRISKDEKNGEFVVEENASDANVNLVTVQFDKSKGDGFAIIVNKDGTYETLRVDDTLMEEIRQKAEKQDSIAFVWTFTGEGWHEELIETEHHKYSWHGSLPNKENGNIVTSGFWFSLNSDISYYVREAEANSFIIIDNGDGTYSADLEFSQY